MLRNSFLVVQLLLLSSKVLSSIDTFAKSAVLEANLTMAPGNLSKPGRRIRHLVS